MRYIFVQRNGMAWHGCQNISAMLKQMGNDVDLILTDYEKRPLEYIKKYQPDFVLFPVITGEHLWVQQFASEVKKELPKVKTVMGGPHATLYPDTLKADFIVCGEADYLEPDLLSKDNGILYYEPVRDITLLPQQDRSIYYKYEHLGKASSKQFLSARGCPFSCSFCFGHMSHKMYPDTPRVRRRTPDQVIGEIGSVRARYGLETVSFTDDVFTLNLEWLKKFLDLYKNEIKLPFICNTRFDIINKELLEMLKDAGCYSLEMGIESGVPLIRQRILNKSDKGNEDIIKAGRLIKSFGLGLKTYNIVGIPTESLEDALETVKLNAEIKADQTSCSFMTPYKYYDIAKYYPDGVELTDSIYKPMKHLSKEIINLQTFFFIATKYPFLLPLIKQLIKLPPNIFYRSMAKLIYGLFMARVHKLTIGDMWRYRKISAFRI
jgi:radical SAM superfamily enzyme YgiQ (UPF0313 family)